MKVPNLTNLSKAKIVNCHRYAGLPLVRCRLPRLMTLLPYLMLVSVRLRYVQYKRGNQHQMGKQHATRPFVMKIGQRGLVMTRSRRERGNSHQMGRLEEATAASSTSTFTTTTTNYHFHYYYYHKCSSRKMMATSLTHFQNENDGLEMMDGFCHQMTPVSLWDPSRGRLLTF